MVLYAQEEKGGGTFFKNFIKNFYLSQPEHKPSELSFRYNVELKGDFHYVSLVLIIIN